MHMYCTCNGVILFCINLIMQAVCNISQQTDEFIKDYLISYEKVSTPCTMLDSIVLVSVTTPYHPHSCLPWCMNYLRQRFGGRRCFHWCWRKQQNHAQVSQLILWYIINFNEIRIQCKILISCAWVYFLQLFHEGTVASLLEASLYYRVCRVESKNNSTPVLIAIFIFGDTSTCGFPVIFIHSLSGSHRFPVIFIGPQRFS